MNPTPDTSDKELELILWRLFENGTNEWEEVHDIGRSVAKAIKELEPYINHRLEEAIDEALIEEIQFLDDANKDNGINFHTGCETNNGWETMRQYTKRRLEQLQDYKKKGSK